MVKNVDQVALGILQVVGVTLPVFLLSINAFAESLSKTSMEDRGVLFGSIILLVSSAIVSAGVLILPVVVLENSLLNASISLLAIGYGGLALTIFRLMDMSELVEVARDVISIGIIISAIIFVLTLIIRMFG